MSSSGAEQSILHVIFDWNGTLIDDLDLAVRAVNHLRERHAYPPIDVDCYRAHFGFPIRAFYERLGFDLEAQPFDGLIRDYLRVFDAQVTSCRLHDGAVAVLDELDALGVQASILSASHRDTLQATLAHFELEKRFVHCVGLSDSHARGKLDLAIELQQALAVPSSRVLYVGDTRHDAEISATLGWSCVIVPRGHQSLAVLEAAGSVVVESLREIAEVVRRRRPQAAGGPRSSRGQSS